MRTISLDQPWASAMALGLKKIETRGTRILGRGPTAIHGAKKWDEDLEYEAADFSRLFNAPGLIDAPRGYIIAVGRIVDCVPSEETVDKIRNQEKMLGNYSSNQSDNASCRERRWRSLYDLGDEEAFKNKKLKAQEYKKII